MGYGPKSIGWMLALTLACVSAMPGRGLAGQQAAGVGPEVNIVVPQRRVWRTDELGPAIEIRSVEVSATATEQAARTTLRLTLHNNTNSMAEAQVLLPVPDGAAIGQFVLEGLGEAGIAKILPADEARKIYNGIVASMRDPALLEFVGTSLVRSSVFPVPAQGQQVVNLTYDHTLEADGDRLEYVLPRSTELMLQGAPWSFTLGVKGQRPISMVYSPTHDTASERLGATSYKVSVSPDAFSGTPGPLRVGWLREPLEAGMLASSFIAYPQADGGGYFMLVAGPPRIVGDAPKVKREVTLVIDKSGSMRGEKIEQAREAAIQVIAGLEIGESFNIIAYSDTIDRFAGAAVVKTAESEQGAIAFIKGIQAVGGTNIHDALLAAVRAEPAPGVLPMVIFLTDGLPTVGETGEVAIREAVQKANTHERRIFGFGVGYDVNAPLLTAVSRATRGAPTFVLPQEDVEAKVGRVFKRLTGPVLASPTLKASDPSRVRDLLPGELPDIFEGDELIVLGRYTSEGQTLRFTLSGMDGPKERTFEMAFDPKRASVEHAFVPRLWAQRRIAQLIDAVRQAGANGKGEAVSKELIDEVIALSTRWGILTEYTAFLAIEPGVALGDQMAVGQRDADAEGTTRLYTISAESQSEPDAPARQMSAGFERAQKDRTGLAGVQQEAMNEHNMAVMWVQANSLQTAGGARVVMTGMRQAGDQTLFARNGRWVDGSLLEREAANNLPVDETIEFASERYFELAGQLAKESRQSVLALGGDVVLRHNGKTILVRGPRAGAP